MPPSLMPSRCPQCGRQAVSFREHLHRLLDIDPFPCAHCHTVLRRNLISWLPVLSALLIVVGTGGWGLIWVSEHLRRQQLLIPLVAVYALLAAIVIVAASYVSWRFVGLHRSGRAPRGKAAA